MSSLHSTPSAKPSSFPLYRRLLFPDLPPSTPVPPILPQASTELNTELYDLLALALRAYITPWWSKITRYDTEFVPQVAAVISVVIRALVARLEKADVEALLLRAIPVAVAQHYSDYRAAAAKLGSAYANGAAATHSQLFHQHQSHMGIDAEGNIDPTYVRHLVDLILHECLPPEDQESDAERPIIREVIVKVVMQDIIPLLSQPWFIYKLMLDQLNGSSQEANASLGKATELPESSSSSTSPSFHSTVVLLLSTVQYLSGLCLTLIQWYKQGVNLAKRVNSTSELPRPEQHRDFAVNLLGSVSEVLNAGSRLASSAAFNVLGFLFGLFDDFADRALVYLLRMDVTTEQKVVTVLKLSKQTLFPNGYPGPPTIIPAPEEQVTIKEQLIRQIEIRIPPVLSNIILGPGSKSRETIVEVLEPLSSQACNAHLILFLLELIVLALFPEFGVEVSAEGDKDGSNGSSLLTSSTSPSPSPEPERNHSSDRGRNTT